MGHSSPDPDVLQTVAQRAPLLERLDDSPADKHELIEALDCSRSTIDRAIRELEWLDLIRRFEGGFQLTVAGQLALAEHRRSVDSFESIAQVSDLLSDLPSTILIAVEMLRGATTLEIPAHAPAEPLEEIVEVIGHANRFRGMSTTDRVPQFHQQFYEQTVEGDLDAEIVLTEEFARYMLAEHTELAQGVVVDGGVDLYTVGSVPYELSIVETPTRSVVFVILLNEDLTHRGIIRNDSRDALEWADGIYRRYRGLATSLSPFETQN